MSANPTLLVAESWHVMQAAVHELYRTAEREHTIVYLLWTQRDILMAVCGTLDRAEQEATDLGAALSQVLRIEARMVQR